jgi:hypothetical protein
MPLIRFDIIEGRTDAEITNLLDAGHRAVLTAFAVPQRDRYQVVTEHKPSRIVAQDTGLGIPRTRNLVLVSVVTRQRSQASKRMFYAESSKRHVTLSRATLSSRSRQTQTKTGVLEMESLNT